jgi:alpha-glucosidase
MQARASLSKRLLARLLTWLLASACAAAYGAGSSKEGHPSTLASTRKAWWKDAIIYEIYPRSFQDSNGDGIGDLNGITQRLGYLQNLGVDAIWIAPMFPSAQVDFGYDVSDYESVDPQYGTLADFDRLVAEAAKRSIHVILDMVLNHTSDQHEWFVEASRSRNSPKHDFYIWNNGRTGAAAKPVPPNNWVSLFGGSAWQYMPQVNQFYYHKFYRQQPDLNWRNPAVERAMFAALRFWLNRGVAGFRLDAIPTLFEDGLLRDEPELGGANAQHDPNLKHIYTDNLPEVHAVIRRMRAMVDHYPGERVLIGETYLPNTAELDKWYGGARHDELQLPMDMLVGFLNKLDAGEFRRLLLELQSQIHGSQPLLVFDNHDNVRSWDRYGDGIDDLEIAKIVATLLLTSKATALLYQGQEIGQLTTPPARVEDVRDPIGITGWPAEKGRDGERTPMQWDTSNRQAGFSNNARTWLPVPTGYERINVQSELADPESLLRWYQSLIQLRRSHAALREGRTVMLDPRNASVLSYVRVDAHGDAVLVSLNMSPTPQTISLDQSDAGFESCNFTTLLASPVPNSTHAAEQSMELPPFAVWVARAQPSSRAQTQGVPVGSRMSSTALSR